MESGYQVTQYTKGFEGKKPRTLRWAMFGLRRRLRGVRGPFTVDNPDHPKADPAQRDRNETLTLVEERMRVGAIGLRLIVRGSAYDQPAYLVRKVAVEPKTPLVDAAKVYLGDRYKLGQIPPPLADCSGLTLKAAFVAYGIELPHQALQQADSELMVQFRDPGDLDPDDFIFYVYGRLGGEIDHVALYIGAGKEIGARPSAGGVAITRIDWDHVVSFGRLRH